MKVAIIGGGISGVITASTLQSDGHECVIFEASSELGGAWRNDAYPGARLQNVAWQYHHPDCNWPNADKDLPGTNPTREQICAYIDYCANEHNLNI